MELNESIRQFVRLLEERHEELKSKLNVFVSDMVGEDKDKKRSAAEDVLSACQTLKNNLSKEDIPPWLTNIISALDNYLHSFDNAASAKNLMLEVIPIYNEIAQNKWKFDDSPKSKAFDFDAVYRKCKDDSNLDKLIDELVKHLNEILVSGEIDSLKVQNLLESVIATLRNHETASHFSIQSMLGFANKLTNNVIWEQLKSTSKLKSFITGFEKTIKETNVSMDELNGKIHDTMKDQYDIDFNFLRNREHNLTEDKKITNQTEDKKITNQTEDKKITSPPEVRTALDINAKKKN